MHLQERGGGNVIGWISTSEMKEGSWARKKSMKQHMTRGQMVHWSYSLWELSHKSRIISHLEV